VRKQDITVSSLVELIERAALRRISNKEPAVYFPGIVERHGEAALNSQAIPMNPELLRLDAFPAFLDARRRNLAGMMNEHLARARG
jgi:hypothetical protein